MCDPAVRHVRQVSRYWRFPWIGKEGSLLVGHDNTCGDLWTYRFREFLVTMESEAYIRLRLQCKNDDTIVFMIFRGFGV
jgi:hypothetical protein